MTSQRAKEIYDQHRNSGDMVSRTPIHNIVTVEEDEEIKSKWCLMAGSCNYNDAFFSFMAVADLPPYMRHRRLTNYAEEA